MSEPWRAELEDAYYSTDTWKDGLVAVARYVLEDPDRWRILLGLDSVRHMEGDPFSGAMATGRTAELVAPEPYVCSVSDTAEQALERSTFWRPWQRIAQGGATSVIPSEGHGHTRDTPAPYTVPTGSEGDE